MGMMIGRMQPEIKSYAANSKAGLQTASVKKAKAKKKSSQKKTKKLAYNFKEISGQILRAKTSLSAGKTVTKARGKVANLRQKLFTGEYDDEDLRHAIIHAEKMLRVAKKRQKHLKQEEHAKQNIEDSQLEELLSESMEETQDAQTLPEDVQELSEISQEEIKKHMEKLMHQMQEMMQEQIEDDQLEEMAEDLTQMSYVDMDAQDLEQLKKKHRQEEMRDIILADMKYLKSVFDKLAREKQEAENNVMSNVALQIGEVEMPVQMMEAPISAEGACIDESV